MKLFWRIFLCFFVGTLLMLAFVMAVSEVLPLTFPGDRETRFEPLTVEPPLMNAVNAYERNGVDGFNKVLEESSAIRHKDAYLFDQTGTPLVVASADYGVSAMMANDVLERNRCQINRNGLRLLYACPVTSVAGHHYATVVTIFTPIARLLNTRFWFNLLVAMLPAAIVCMLLTLYLTRPIAKLQTAAQRLANGELNARAGPLRFSRKDELGDLARDFDAMASKIELLMTAQRRFVADVSHELGGPLTRMHLALALLRRQQEPADNTSIRRLERETDKLSNLVQQLLLLASLEAGRIPAETFVPLSIRSLCDSVIEDANFEASHTGCRVIGTRQDVSLLVLPQLLRRAIDNVLRNAIRYSPAQSAIEFNCSVDLIGRCVTLDILDSGPGVPQEMLQDIFRPFFRPDSGRAATTGGTGLGLSIAYEAVRMHSGTIEARNRDRGGLHVRIQIPIRATDQFQDLRASEAASNF